MAYDPRRSRADEVVAKARSVRCKNDAVHVMGFGIFEDFVRGVSRGKNSLGTRQFVCRVLKTPFDLFAGRDQGFGKNMRGCIDWNGIVRLFRRIFWSRAILC